MKWKKKGMIGLNKMSELSIRIENALDENSALLDIAETPDTIANDSNLLNKAMANHNRIIEIINTNGNLPDPTPEGICKL